MSRTREITSSTGSSVAGFTFDSSELMSHVAGATLPFAALGTKSQVTKETSASGSAAGVSSAFGHAVGEQLLRIEGRDIGGQLRDRQREIAGEPHIGTHAHHFALAHPRAARNPQRSGAQHSTR